MKMSSFLRFSLVNTNSGTQNSFLYGVAKQLIMSRQQNSYLSKKENLPEVFKVAPRSSKSEDV